MTQPDTIVPDPANPQDWNRYSYARNNPLKYIDPSGHSPCEEFGGICLSERQVTRKYETERQRKRDGNDSGVNQHEPLIYCAEGFLNCSASFTQDIATSIDFFSAGLTLVFAVEGCKAGLKGCAAGYGLGLMTHNMVLNPLESAMSAISLTLTFFLNFQKRANWKWGAQLKHPLSHSWWVAQWEIQ